MAGVIRACALRQMTVGQSWGKSPALGHTAHGSTGPAEGRAWPGRTLPDHSKGMTWTDPCGQTLSSQRKECVGVAQGSGPDLKLVHPNVL